MPQQLGEKTVFGSLVLSAGLLWLYKFEQGKWFGGDYKHWEALLITYMFLAITSTFAPDLAGATAIAVFLVLLLKLGPTAIGNLTTDKSSEFAKGQ